MAGEEPAVAVEVFGCVLEFAVLGFVQVFDDLCAFGFGVGVVGFDVFDEDGEVLGLEAELCRARAAARVCDHDVRLTEMHLRAAGGAVTVVLREAEDAG